MKKLLVSSLLVAILLVTMAIPVHAQTYGPRIDKITIKVIKSPDVQVKAMKTGEADMYTGLIRPGDVEELGDWGAEILSTPGYHFCYLATNLRAWDNDTDGIPEAGWPAPYDAWGDPVPGYVPNDAETKRHLLDVNFRLAVAHLVPKEIIIGTIFKYIVVRVDTPCPPALGLYYNPDAPAWDFDPEEAKQILLDAGYTWDGTDWHHPDHTNEALGQTQFASPTYEEAPTSFTIVKMTVDEMNKIGIPAQHDPQTFPFPLVYNTLYWHQFDQYFLCWGLTRFPDHLWSFFHSSNDRLNGFNTPGVNDTYLDSLLDTIKTSLVLGDVIDAAKEAQYLLMGGGAPMADYALCYIPIYSRNYFDSYNPDFTGMINMAGYSSDNSWTARNMEYGTETQYTYIIGTEPYNFNPLYSRASDEIACWGPVLGGGIAVNPYTGKDFPFEVTEWDYAEIASGMIINFTLRDGVEWHDGTYFTAEDAKFSWDYLYEFQPATWIDVWNFYDNCTIVEAAGPTGGGKVSVYVTTTSLWLVYDYAGTISMLQKDVWSHVGPAGTTLTKDPGTTIDGTLYNGDPLDFECWKTNHPADVDITDPTTATTFKLTCLVGTGDWIWKGYNEPGLYCELVANRDWWMSQTELTDTLKDMFYHYGDASKDTVKVDITDLSLAGLAFGTWPGKTGWNPDCDLAPDAWPFGEGYAHGSWGDNIVDIEDLRHIGAAFGKQREYP